ncbi:MAG: cytochrome c [Mangrovibacterium sp.]
MTKLFFLLVVATAIIITGCGSGNQEKPKALETSALAKKHGAEIDVSAKSLPHPGEKVYKQYCQVCHQANGAGVSGVFPPLTPNKYIADKTLLIELVLHGMTGEIEVDGEKYNSLMAPHDHLTDLELANVISYVRSNFGNKLDPVTAEEVAAVRNK